MMYYCIIVFFIISVPIGIIILISLYDNSGGGGYSELDRFEPKGEQ